MLRRSLSTIFFLAVCLASDGPSTPRDKGTRLLDPSYSAPSTGKSPQTPRDQRTKPRSAQTSPAAVPPISHMQDLSTLDSGGLWSIIELDSGGHSLQVIVQSASRQIDPLQYLGIFVKTESESVKRFLNAHKKLIRKFFVSSSEISFQQWLAKEVAAERSKFEDDLRLLAENIFKNHLGPCHQEPHGAEIDFNARGPGGSAPAGAIHKDNHCREKPKDEYTLYSLWLPLSTADAGVLAICADEHFADSSYKSPLKADAQQEVEESECWVTTRGLPEGGYVLFPASRFYHGAEKVKATNRFSLEFKWYVKTDGNLQERYRTVQETDLLNFSENSFGDWSPLD